MMFVSCSIFVNFVPGKVKQDLYIGTTFINKQEGYTRKAFDFGVVTILSKYADIFIEATEDIKVIELPRTENIYHPTRKDYKDEPVLKGWLTQDWMGFEATLNNWGRPSAKFSKRESAIDYLLNN